MISDDELIARLRKQHPHDEMEDCWYSCAMLCCDDARKSSVCDCGADNINSLHVGAVARIVELKAEFATCQRENVELSIRPSLEEWSAMMARAVKAEDEREALREDAERYRWLRIQTWDSSAIAVVAEPKVNVRLGSYCPSHHLLDAAIDAARKA